MKDPPRPALDNFSLELRPSERIALLGPSGSGKSTLLHILSGFIPPDTGSVVIAGVDSTHAPVRQRDVGLVFQSLALFPHMTVEQNVAFGLKMHKVARQERARRVRDALDLVEMGKFASRRPSQLSGGQQQRVAFARAIVTRPSVLLLDEPFGALDTRLREGIRREFIELQEATGISTVLVTHDQAEALEFGQRVAVMGQARLLQVDRPEVVYRRPATTFVAGFVGQGAIVSATVVALREGALQVRLEADSLMEVPIEFAPGLLTRGEKVSILLRPEWVQLAEPGHDGSGLTATVERVQFAGARFDVSCRLPSGGLVVCGATAGSRYQRGDRVTLQFAPEHRPCIYNSADGELVQ